MAEEFFCEIENNFTIIPNEIWDYNLTAYELAVLCRIFRRAGAKAGSCFESRKNIAKACGMSPRQVDRVIEELELHNIIEIESRKDTGRPNLIRIKSIAQWTSKTPVSPKREGGFACQAKGGKTIRQTGLACQANHISISSKETQTEGKPVFVASAPADAPETPQTALTVVEPKKVKAKTKPDPKDDTRTAETWQAYEEWFQKRYNVKPPRNLKVNSQLKQFCERVGYEDAPKVITFYLFQNDYYYVKQMHTIGIALADAEKLVTGYRRGSITSRREADYIDKTSSRKSHIDNIVELLEAEDAQNGGSHEH
jgi:hypothetical protein